MGVHDGHRQRMKERFLEGGLDNFNDINALELLLFYALPRCDTNVVAHRLLDRFGSLPAVLEATADELSKVDGIGESAAVLLALVPQVSRRYMTEKAQTLPSISGSAEAGRYFLPKFMYERDEVVYMACLDSAHRVTSCREIGRGVVNAAEVSVRRIVELALQQNAAAVILAHNHPSGTTEISQQDKHITQHIVKALALVEVRVLDHLVVGNETISFAELGLL